MGDFRSIVATAIYNAVDHDRRQRYYSPLLLAIDTSNIIVTPLIARARAGGTVWRSVREVLYIPRAHIRLPGSPGLLHCTCITGITAA